MRLSRFPFLRRPRPGLSLLLIATFACGPAAQAQTWGEIDFAKALLLDLQEPSFAKRREYCGFIGYDAAGNLTATQAEAGTQASCHLVWPSDMRVIASYHTHGAFDDGYFNELPSDIDMRSDQAHGINGWISTPGGRLWHVDSKRMVARLICGSGCLPTAPGFYKSHSGDIAKSYTYEELQRRLSR